MAQMTVSKLDKSYGVVTILEDVSFHVEEKDKIGIVGSNGSGKTTLFRCLTGEIEPERGSISMRSDLEIGYLKQNVHIQSQKTVYEECLQAYERAFAVERELRSLEKQMEEVATDPKALADVMDRYQKNTERFEELGGLSYQSEIRGVLKGFGFEEDRWEQTVDSLSGGEKSRLEIAILLLGRPDVLLLDEPTNHLDMQTIDFLEGFLRDFRGAILLISHDRYFLDRVVNRVFLIEHHHLHAYNCGYEEYTKRRRKDLQIQQEAYDNQQKEIERQKEIIDRLSRLGGSKRKRGISQSRSRQKLLDKMELVEAPPTDEEKMRLRFTPKYTSGNDVLEAKDVAKSFGERTLFEQVNFLLRRGERVALIGANGVGKTTLFRMILGKEPIDVGTIKKGSAVKSAYFDQEQAGLDDEKTVIDEVWDRYPLLNHYDIRSYLAKFQFIGDDIFSMIGDLSGGEKARVALLKLMMSSANLLLLDEPTNHLDIDSKEVLEDALQIYDGTVFVISHDRYFINRVATRILELTPEGVNAYLGNYDDYLEKSRAGEPDAVLEDGPTKTQQKKEQKKRNLESRQRRATRAKVGELERTISKLETEIAELEREAYDPSLYEDHEAAAAHHQRIEEKQTALDEATDEWFALQELLLEDD